MDMHFNRGDPAQPKGHALLYFHSSQGAVLATYIVVLPIALQIGKYLPPLLAAQVTGLSSASPNVVPIPPVPEQVDDLTHLEQLASARDDDLLYGGTLDPQDVERSMRSTMEFAHRYLQLYEDFAALLSALDAKARAPEESGLDTREVIYSLMGEHDRLQELSKLTGQLRYAVDGADARHVAETVQEMELLAKYLPAKYQIAMFIEAAKTSGERGRRLAELHMERCYKLFQEDYVSLGKVDAELRRIQQMTD